MLVAVKRVYESPAPADGTRVLVDRLWPRGLSKQTAGIKRWLRNLAPSQELRKWFHARPEQWPAFRKCYLKELGNAPATEALEELYQLARAGKITLLFASKNLEHNNATVLKELLSGTRKPPTGTGPATARALRTRQSRSLRG